MYATEETIWEIQVHDTFFRNDTFIHTDKQYMANFTLKIEISILVNFLKSYECKYLQYWYIWLHETLAHCSNRFSEHICEVLALYIQ